MIDGEAVYCGPDGVADFAALQGRARDRHVIMYAFDLLELNGVVLELLPRRRGKPQFKSCLFAHAGEATAPRRIGNAPLKWGTAS